MDEAIKCDSCGDDLRSSEYPKGHRCRGCGLNVCQSCVDVFGHFRKEGHGTGNPAHEVRKMRAALDLYRWAGEAFKKLEFTNLLLVDIRRVREPWQLVAVTVEGVMHAATGATPTEALRKLRDAMGE